MALRRPRADRYTYHVIRRFALLLSVLTAFRASAAVLSTPVVAPPAAISFAPVTIPGLGLPPSLLTSPALALSAAPAESLPLAAPAAAPVPALAATENGLIRASSVEEGLSALRVGSYETHPQTAEIVSRIRARYPELPITAENLFLVRDPEVLRVLEIPEDAAGAARIVTDGNREVPVVILVAGRGVSLDAFVEYAVHEAVHLMDDGILRVRHDQELKHFFAEGWTQKRAVVMADEILKGLGRPGTEGTAYHREIALISAFAALHGTEALDELVRTGSDAGLRRALGSRWELAARLVSGAAPREKRLNALIALTNADAVGPEDERVLLDYARAN
jgi:hypothetical protein